ncbi:MAG: single-stranded-DNA-specific exonuclease RecJ [Pseudomonadota bacterium]
MFLSVGASLTGRRWIGPDKATVRASDALAQIHGLPLPLCSVLARRGVGRDDVNGFLAPSLRDLMPDPHVLKDVDTAATRIVQALLARDRIAIFADYDVDGASSAALLMWTARFFGISPTLYVPDRIDEGYGPNAPAMKDLAASHDLIICVDCGTLSHDALAAAAGADVLVLDHHLGGETLPPAMAVVNPNRQDETGELDYLCAAGVVFMVLVDVGRKLRAEGQPTPDLMGLLDLVALATVADVAPLVGLNRAFVRQGLKIMATRSRPGLVALGDVARLDTAPSAYHLGYVLGPRINAGGRIGQADLGARLLAADSMPEAAGLATRLDDLNTDRRTVEASVRAAAIEQAETRGLNTSLVWAAGDGWHPGVVGIVAARLKETANRPSVVIGFDGDTGKGSGRSVAGIDLGAAIQKLAHEGLIEKGGGHKMAAGLSLSRAQLPHAMERLATLLEAQGAGTLGPRDLRLDGIVTPTAAQVALVEVLEQAGPYGSAAPAPRFVLPDMRVNYSKRVGETHLKLTLTSDGHSIDAIAFGAFEGPIGPALEDHGGNKFHIAGRLEVNTWGGRSRVQLRVEDAAPAISHKS